MVQITLNQPIEIPHHMIEELARVEIKERIKNEQLTMSVSLNDLIEMTGVSKSTLEKVFVPLEETKAIEYRVGTKRLWLYPEVRGVWREFLEGIR